MIWLPKDVWAGQSLSGLPAGAGGDAAFRLFCMPELSHYRAPNHQQLTARARFHLRNARWQRVSTPVADIQVYVFDPDRREPLGNVLVAHGWTGEASFMTAIAEPIRRAGYRVVLFDFPAHGLSGGRSTNLIECARATAMIGRQFGPLSAIVAHSFGGMISLVAVEGYAPMRHALDVPRIALIASPNCLSEVTGEFAERWGLNSAGRRAFEARLERVSGRAISCFTVVKLLRATGCQALVVHDREDHEISFGCAEEITSKIGSAELKTYSGFGHRNILFAPPVARTIVSYLLRAEERAEQPTYSVSAA
ncbi:alpha/beta hydrolase [Hyphomicrobium sp. 99]|uniref:alpha/beta hydrolase n=1 Tax=Hyphomicrobium sp. 99 TaxID=1163419 RepID=UPI0005F881DE|nr:alpha/beta fold hydrolase [Hyphomicrobium sp. 99]